MLHKLPAFLFLFLLCLALTGCTNQEKTAEALLEEVLDIHDVAMAKMDSLALLKSQLNQRTTTEGTDSVDVQHPEAEKIRQAIEKLDAADEMMMQWMRAFKMPDPATPAAQRIDYLLKEKEKIIEVKNAMREAINQAKETLKPANDADEQPVNPTTPEG